MAHDHGHENIKSDMNVETNVAENNVLSDRICELDISKLENDDDLEDIFKEQID
jgi:hypothetical protein